MRKMNYLYGGLALCVGILVGTLSMSMLTNSSSPTSFISKLRGQDKIQTVSGVVTQDGLSKNSSALEDPSLSATSAGQNDALSPEELEANKEKIITDYKQNIGLFFGAWKSADMDTFRVKLAEAYTGKLFERHAQRAEEYLGQGIGLDVTQITFDRVDVESFDTNTATLRAEYTYTARDFSLADGTPVGEEHEQIVQVRVNLVKQDSRWIITGESTTQ